MRGVFVDGTAGLRFAAASGGGDGKVGAMTKHEVRANFTNMADSTQGDWLILGVEFVKFAQGLPDRVLAHLKLLEGDCGGFPVDRLTHSLQTATLAHNDGRDEEYVVCALLHDIGDTLGSFNHPDIAAAILRPFVSEENLWMVEKHGVFQGYYFFHHVGMDRNMREQFRGHAYFARTEEFCAKYDGPAFDPKGAVRPLSFFEPMVRRVFAQPTRSMYVSVVEKAS
jgi:predicted HD phosphohydrolase